MLLRTINLLRMTCCLYKQTNRDSVKLIVCFLFRCIFVQKRNHIEIMWEVDASIFFLVAALESFQMDNL